MYPVERLLFFKEKISFFNLSSRWDENTAFQVLICARNAEELLPMVLNSIEEAME